MTNLENVKKIIDSITSPNLTAHIKNSDGRYLCGNNAIAELGGIDSPDDMQGRKDNDFIWRDNYHIYWKDDCYIHNNQLSAFFFEPVLNAENTITNLLAVKAPFTDLESGISGTYGIGVKLNDGKIDDILSDFIFAANTLKLKLDLNAFLKIVTKALQLKNIYSQVGNKKPLFQYGDIKFSLREAQCLHYLLNNHSADETSKKLGISRKTVEFHIANIKLKLSCFTKGQISQKAVEHGFIELMFLQF